MENHNQGKQLMESEHGAQRGENSFYLVVVAVVVVLLYVLVFGLITQYAWNYSVHELFNWPSMTLLQAVALLILVKVVLHPMMTKSSSVVYMTPLKDTK